MIKLLFGLALSAAVPVGFGIAVDLIEWRNGRRVASPMLIALVIAAPAVLALALPRGAVAAGLVVPWVILGALTGLGFTLERILNERVANSEDAKEGPRAFTEKRPPEYTGR